MDSGNSFSTELRNLIPYVFSWILFLLYAFDCLSACLSLSYLSDTHTHTVLYVHMIQ